MRAVKIFVGAVIGLMVGTVLGFVAAVWKVSRDLPPQFRGQSVGYDPVFLRHEPIFWAVLLLSVLGFAYLFSRIGRRNHSSRV